MPRMRWLGAVFILNLLAVSNPLLAATAYKCVDARGAISFQDQPCQAGTRQSTIALPDTESTTTAPTQASTEDDPAASPPTGPALPTPAQIPPPAFYLCTRYDGSRYISDTGEGGSALVPLGVLGVPGRSLSDAYGGPNGIGVSAPGLRTIPHMPASKAPFGGMDTWIDDQCHFAPPREACAYLRASLDDVTSKLRRAFSDTEADLQQQQAALRERMHGC